MNFQELKEFLDFKASKYEQSYFIEKDPIIVPHHFIKKEDVEISGFLIATIAWGNRSSILKSGFLMMKLMDNDPFNFVIHHSEEDLKKISKFIHRTFNGIDFCYFIKSLKNIYIKYNGLEIAFSKNIKAERMEENISHFKKVFFELKHNKRTEKHISDPLNGSAAKRLNMFLRWMVRSSKNQVDFGLWNRLNPSQLSCPLDIHTGNVARYLGLINRKKNDQKALKELDNNLRMFDPNDPVKYDFALFGLGIYENINS